MTIKINHISATARVGSDPTRHTVNTSRGESTVASVRVCLDAVPNKPDANGQWPDKSIWIEVKVWGKATEAVMALKKGDTVYIEGPLGIKRYESNGEKRESLVMESGKVGDRYKEVSISLVSPSVKVQDQQQPYQEEAAQDDYYPF